MNEARGSLLSGARLRERLCRQAAEGGIVLAPLLETPQIAEVTVDVRLGTEFLVSLATRNPVLDPARRDPEATAAAFFQRTFRDFGEPFVMYPDRFVLGCTFEYVRLPLDVCAELHGRSSLGRAGIAIRGFLQPGYTGVLTLELTNTSGTTFILRPGMRVAQLSFFEVEPSSSSGYFAPGSAKYLGAVGPQVTALADEPEWGVLDRMRREREGDETPDSPVR